MTRKVPEEPEVDRSNPWGFKKGDVLRFNPEREEQRPRWYDRDHRLFTEPVRIEHVPNIVYLHPSIPKTRQAYVEAWETSGSIGVSWLTKAGTWSKRIHWFRGNLFRKIVNGTIDLEALADTALDAIEEFGEAHTRRRARAKKKTA